MTYVPPKYPSEIPTIGDLPDRSDNIDWFYASRYNEIKKELRAIMTELGTLPKGDFADVKTRLEEGGPKSKCRITRGVPDQAIPHNTQTVVQFDNVYYDVLGEWDDSVNFRFNPQKAGYYIINGAVSWTGFPADQPAGVIVRTDAGTIIDITFASPVGGVFGQVIAAIIFVDTGGWLDISVFQTTGASQDIYAHGNNTFLTIHRQA